MTNVKHTPGPWAYRMGDICVEGSDGDDRVIAGIGKSCGARSSVYSTIPNSKPEGVANARLIAAAPDLLVALRDALWALDNAAAVLSANGIQSTLTDPRPQMRAAIAKAEGRDR